jgi:Flp pilus assembly protein TadG
MRASLHNVWRPKRGRRGSAILEFTLAGTFIFLPILAGLATVGMSMVTAMQVASLNSTAAQMLASGVDFTEAANQNILLTVAGNLNTSTSGGGIVILSQISYTPENGYVCFQSDTADQHRDRTQWREPGHKPVLFRTAGNPPLYNDQRTGCLCCRDVL